MSALRDWASGKLERLGARAHDRHEHELSDPRGALHRTRATLDDEGEQLVTANLELLALRTQIRPGRLGAVREADLREFERLAAMPSGEAGTTELLGFELCFLDGPMFLGTYVPIFVQEIYAFVPRRPNPRILDCGANIGLATIYWKRLVPEASIVAFEPDSSALRLLERNLGRAGIGDVEVVPSAVWTSEDTVDLARPDLDSGHLGSRIVEHESAGAGDVAVTVTTVRLRDYLEEPIDFLKLDIEGAETEVILDCADRLENVTDLFVEYHGFVDQRSRLVELLTAINDAGFSVFVEQEHAPVPSPFVHRPDRGGMDVQLNLFCSRT